MRFPFDGYRPGQKAMIGEVYRVCAGGGQLLCQAPTGIGKTISVLFPALKAVGEGGPVFYLTARGTTRAAAEAALASLHARQPRPCAAQHHADGQGQDLPVRKPRVHPRSLPLRQRLL